MRKLCHLFFDEYPKDSRIRRYTNALIKEGYQVFIVCLKGDSDKFFEKDENLCIYRIPMRKKRGSFFSRFWEYVLFQIFSTFLVSYLMISKKIDIFHVHTLPDFLVLACIIPKLLGAKIILDFHELFPEFMLQHKPSLQESFILTVLKFQEKISFKFADEIVTFHDPAKEILLSRINSPKKVTTIMNGVDESELPKSVRELLSLRENIVAYDNRVRGNLSEKIGGKLTGDTFVEELTDMNLEGSHDQYQDDFKIIYNGTINYNLNLALVVKALAEIRDVRPDIYSKTSFHLYGDGPDLHNILSTAKKLGVNNVSYHGRLKFEDMILELVNSSLCILPPKRDIYSELYYSLKLTEMIYFKIPVIATRLKTYLRYFSEKSIFYFDSEDVSDLATKIIYVYENRNEVEHYINNAFEEYQNYNWEIMKGRYIVLINGLVN